jgi:hypothetical protein
MPQHAPDAVAALAADADLVVRRVRMTESRAGCRAYQQIVRGLSISQKLKRPYCVSLAGSG